LPWVPQAIRGGVVDGTDAPAQVRRPVRFDIIPLGGRGNLNLKLLAVFSLSCAFLLACGSGGRSDTDGTAGLPGNAAAIRDIDFASLPESRALVDQLGSGAIDKASTLYADLTGDRREEAIVPVTSQGTLGNIAYLVLRLDSGKPELVLTRTLDKSSASGLQMSVEDGVLQETRGVYGPEDPFCCPSQLRETTFQWDGSKLQVKAERLVQQPPGAKN
jgi:hypothetical protein